MLKVPYIKQPDDMSCALACYAMTTQYFFPEASFEEIAKVADWQKGYVVWAYKFWLWIMNKGIKITDYDLVDPQIWANEGIEGLRRSVSEKEFKFYIENTKNINSYSEDIKKVLNHPNFTYLQQKPTFKNLEEAVRSGKLCEIILDPRTLRDKEGFSLHRVVILGIENGEVLFHDPAIGPNLKAHIDQFKKAWLEAVPNPDLCIYQKRG